MFYFCRKPQYKDAFEATANFLRMNNIAYEVKGSNFRMAAESETKTFEVVENETPLGALSSSAMYVPKFSITISNVSANSHLDVPLKFITYKTNFNYKIEKFGETSYFSGPEWSDKPSHFITEFEIYNEYNKQLEQLFTDIKHALNPEFWVNPDKILKLEEEQNETSTSCCGS
jgi:hypothetical protein